MKRTHKPRLDVGFNCARGIEMLMDEDVTAESICAYMGCLESRLYTILKGARPWADEAQGLRGCLKKYFPDLFEGPDSKAKLIAKGLLTKEQAEGGEQILIKRSRPRKKK